MVIVVYDQCMNSIYRLILYVYYELNHYREAK